MVRGPFGEVEEIFEEILGTIEMVRMAITIANCGDPVRIKCDEHTTHRTGILRTR
jgi:hypothetical protein